MRDRYRVAPAWRGHLSDVPPLSREEEIALFLAWKGGDKRAADRLYRSLMRYMLGFGLRYARRSHIDLDDLMGEIGLGFMKALEMFDPERGYRLITYGTWWFRAFVEDYVQANTAGAMDMTLTSSEARAVKHIRASGITDIDELSRRHRMLKNTVKNALAAVCMYEMRLDAPCFGEEGSWMDRLVDDAPRVDEVLAQDEADRVHNEALAEALASLKPQWREVLIERHAPEPLTFVELGARFGCSKQHVHKIEGMALWQVTNFVCRLLGVPVPPDVVKPQARKFFCTGCNTEGHETRRCPKRAMSARAVQSKRFRKRRASTLAAAA